MACTLGSSGSNPAATRQQRQKRIEPCAVRRRARTRTGCSSGAGLGNRPSRLTYVSTSKVSAATHSHAATAALVASSAERRSFASTASHSKPRMLHDPFCSGMARYTGRSPLWIIRRFGPGPGSGPGPSIPASPLCRSARPGPTPGWVYAPRPDDRGILACRGRRARCSRV
jgi:hypothetical protein